MVVLHLVQHSLHRKGQGCDRRSAARRHYRLHNHRPCPARRGGKGRLSQSAERRSRSGNFACSNAHEALPRREMRHRQDSRAYERQPAQSAGSAAREDRRRRGVRALHFRPRSRVDGRA